jgi:hypothetical protein
MSAAEFEELLASWQARYSELEALYEHVRKEYHELSSRTAEPCAPSTEPVEEDEHVKLTPDSATEQLPPSNDLVRSSARAGLTLFEHPTALVTYVLLTGTGTFNGEVTFEFPGSFNKAAVEAMMERLPDFSPGSAKVTLTLGS